MKGSGRACEALKRIGLTRVIDLLYICRPEPSSGADEPVGHALAVRIDVEVTPFDQRPAQGRAPFGCSRPTPSATR